MPATYTVYKGHSSPFKYVMKDVNDTPYSTSEMAGITRVKLWINSTFADSDAHSTAFDWTSNESRSEIIIDIGGIDIATGTDNYAELIVYDADYTDGRVVDSLSVNIDGTLYSGGGAAPGVNSGYNIVALSDLSSHGDYSGLTESVSLAEASTAIGVVYAYNISSQKYVKAKADAIGTMPGAVITLATASTSTSCLVMSQGYLKSTAWSWTSDNSIKGLFVSSSSAGEMSENAATGSGHYQQIVANIYSSHIVYFNPAMLNVNDLTF